MKNLIIRVSYTHGYIRGKVLWRNSMGVLPFADSGRLAAAALHKEEVQNARSK